MRPIITGVRRAVPLHALLEEYELALHALLLALKAHLEGEPNDATWAALRADSGRVDDVNGLLYKACHWDVRRVHALKRAYSGRRHKVPDLAPVTTSTSFKRR